MKNRYLKIITLTAILLLSLCLLACSSGSGSGGKSTVEDRYGFKRETNSFQSQSLLLSSFSDVEELIGTSGASGLLSDYAVKNNGKNLSSDDMNYLVCLIYGNSDNVTIGPDDMEVTTSFTLVTPYNVLRNEDCASYNPYYGFYYAMSDPTKTFDDYIVIPFHLNEAGTLFAELRVECPKMSQSERYIVEPYCTATVGNLIEKTETVSVTSQKLQFLTENDYNQGNFTDSDLKDTPDFTGGASNYAVLDLVFKTDSIDAGVNVMINFDTNDSILATVEDAPTCNIEEMNTRAGYTVFVKFNYVYNPDGDKSTRIVLRLDPVFGGDFNMAVYIGGNTSTDVGCNGFMTCALKTVPPPFGFTMDNDKTYYTLTELQDKTATSLVIPNTYRGLPVKYVKEGIFHHNSYLETIVLGDNIESLPAETFRFCTNLKSITFGSGFKSLSNNLFIACYALDNVTIPEGIWEISEGCFYGCSSLKTLNLPSTITHVRFNAFKECTSLEALTFSEGLVVIERYAFTLCYSLKRVNVPTTLQVICEYAFNECTSLESVTLNPGTWYTSYSANTFDIISDINISSPEEAADILTSYITDVYLLYSN